MPVSDDESGRASEQEVAERKSGSAAEADLGQDGSVSEDEEDVRPPVSRRVIRSRPSATREPHFESGEDEEDIESSLSRSARARRPVSVQQAAVEPDETRELAEDVDDLESNGELSQSLYTVIYQSYMNSSPRDSNKRNLCIQSPH